MIEFFYILKSIRSSMIAHLELIDNIDKNVKNLIVNGCIFTLGGLSNDIEHQVTQLNAIIKYLEDNFNKLVCQNHKLKRPCAACGEGE